MNRARLATTISLALVLSLLSLRSTADQTPAQAREQLLAQARGASIPCYERTLPNGVRRLYLSPRGRQQLAAMERALPQGCNVLEVCHLGSPTANHSMFIFDRSMIHFQYLNGTNNWRLRGWGGWDPQGRNPLRDGGSKLYSAAIQLTSAEAGNLRRLLEASWREQGPEGTAGATWENGHIKTGMGNRSFNCVSAISEARIGQNGETLAQICGLPHSYNGDPRGLQRALETQANERVFGICSYGPADPSFGQNPNQNQVNF